MNSKVILLNECERKDLANTRIGVWAKEVFVRYRGTYVFNNLPLGQPQRVRISAQDEETLDPV